MTYEVTAKDESGVPRCWGFGDDLEWATQECLTESAEYLIGRKDIKALYLFEEDGKPIMVNEQLTVRP